VQLRLFKKKALTFDTKDPCLCHTNFSVYKLYTRVQTNWETTQEMLMSIFYSLMYRYRYYFFREMLC